MLLLLVSGTNGRAAARRADTYADPLENALAQAVRNKEKRGADLLCALAASDSNSLVTMAASLARAEGDENVRERVVDYCLARCDCPTFRDAPAAGERLSSICYLADKKRACLMLLKHLGSHDLNTRMVAKVGLQRCLPRFRESLGGPTVSPFEGDKEDRERAQAAWISWVRKQDAKTLAENWGNR